MKTFIGHKRPQNSKDQKKQVRGGVEFKKTFNLFKPIDKVMSILDTGRINE